MEYLKSGEGEVGVESVYLAAVAHYNGGWSAGGYDVGGFNVRTAEFLLEAPD